MSESDPQKKRDWENNPIIRGLGYIGIVWGRAYSNYSADAAERAKTTMPELVQPEPAAPEPTQLSNRKTRQDRDDVRELRKMESPDQLIELFTKLPDAPADPYK